MTEQERYRTARQDDSLVVLEGFHALKHAIRFGALILDAVSDDPDGVLALAASLAPDLHSDLSDAGFMRATTSAVFASLSPSPHPTRVTALARRPQIDVDAVFATAGPGSIVVLDNPRHAGNIGAAVRVAAAAGADGLFVTGGADPWQPASVRGAAGLQFALPVGRLADLPATPRTIIGVDAAGDDFSASEAFSGSVLVFGSERDGIGPLLQRRVQRSVRIPMRDGVSSLNLATAVAIMLYRDR